LSRSIVDREQSGGAMTEKQQRVEVEAAEQREAAATLALDLAALEAIWDAELIAYSTADVYARKAVLLDMMRGGVIRLRSHQRHTVEVVFEGDLAIAIGNENSEAIGRGGAVHPLYCSYMNVWIRRSDGWKLLSRYVGRIEQR
jgi:ketosteroid isomerase-like protein